MPQGDHIYNCYAPPPQEFVRGEGVYLYTEDGEKYLDFIAGIAVSGLGHSHPALVSTLKDQADKLWHLSNMFRTKDQFKLADKYCEATFADKVFFTNSGAEAVECAIKTARRCQYVEGHEERYEILSLQGAFHGRTIATVTAGGNPKYMEGFGPAMLGYTNLPFGDLDVIKDAINENTAAILMEPVQGEGGIRALPVQFLKDVRKLCDEHGLLLIFDEVQCGAGRTGKLFAHQWANGDADPDIMAVAKGMGGGFPMGACLATERAAAGMVVGTHGSTYGGGPLAMAVGNAVFDELNDPGLLAHVVKVSNFLHQQFQGLKDAHPDIVEDVRGKGLLCGMKLKKKALDVRNLAREHKLLVGNAGDNTLRFVPPLVITEDNVRDAIAVLDKVFTEAKSMPDFEA
ncbi:aspartate aminotransferase family protein [Pseudophaeobacter arcticus]|uniref:aspartate aminotransferase family protein n=1 Tax=Pseudophaeobacter arcticus TaxID=385492 RepID=UPI0024918D2B|nr:aspartate aminotransferase family protein [Pseudophaeobacter arcticus]